MAKTKKQGKQTVFFSTPPTIIGTAAVAGAKEGEGPLGKHFDTVVNDGMWGEDSWEKAESKFMEQAVRTALDKCNLSTSDIDYIFGGDLLNQCISTNYGIRSLNIPFIGLYGACSTMALSMSMGAMCIDGGYADKCVSVTSSHFCSAERQFRFPLEYGGQRPPSAQWTATGSGCAILSSSGDGPKIDCITTGKIVDMGIKDANNMGAAMAPAAADTLVQHFKDTSRSPKDYDLIVSGDLGSIGKSIVIDMLKENGYDLSKNYDDCGLILFDCETQDVHAGGSGCGCSALTFCGYLYKLLETGKYKRILFMATGALMSTTSVQQGESIPGIAHAVSIVSSK
jgi:stage V sporulation protein AD